MFPEGGPMRNKLGKDTGTREKKCKLQQVEYELTESEWNKHPRKIPGDTLEIF